jgi:hypothetical protein
VNLFGCKKKEEKGKMRRFQVANGEWRIILKTYLFLSQSLLELNLFMDDLYQKNATSDHSPLATRHLPLATSLNCAPLPLFSQHAKR